MSGGFYDYKQLQIRELWMEMQNQLNRQGKPKLKHELTLSEDFYDDYPEGTIHPKFSEGVQAIMKDAIKYLKIAEVFTNRLDQFFSEHDSDEDVLFQKLEKDIEELNLTD